MYRCHCRLTVLWSVLFLTGNAFGATIDFEKQSDGQSTPVDNAEVVGIFQDGPTYVEFGFDTDANNVIDRHALYEARPSFSGVQDDSDDKVAYWSYRAEGEHDGDLYGVGGDWLLRAPGGSDDVGGLPSGAPFLIVYSGELPNSASGQIWDIDGVLEKDRTEQWTIEALDEEDAVIASILSPLGTDYDRSYDSEAWEFSFSNLLSPIAKIRITSEGRPGPIGFDNFNATSASVPEPTSLALWSGLGVMGLIAARRRRKAA